ncbi:efflux RND transporter periplasmic adaptor subunit [Chitinimonas sp.]|uniref:efflux RND transporter periplasmic adaptor subunit n=1 Tax=Chitinimonas sp. TaxID=1934313 RepID=UPI002F94A7B9
MQALRSRFNRRTVVVSVCAALALGGIVASQSGQAANEKEKAGDKDKKPAVVLELAASDIATVTDGSLIQPLALSGTLSAVRQTAINAEVEGVVSEVLVRPGEVVKAGQTLGRFETSDLGHLLATRQANLERSRAEMQLAEKNRDRSANLLKQGFISPNSNDATENSLAVAAAQYRADQAQLAMAQKAMHNSIIRATFSGIVSERKVEPGSRVAMNQRLFSVVDLSELEFEAAVPVNGLAAVKVGQEVTLTIEGFTGREMKGRVERIAPVADSASRMVPVYVRLKNPDGALKGGMFAQGQLAIARADHAATLPFGAIRDLGTAAPYVLAVENGKAVRRPVKLGLLNELSKHAVIESGAQPGTKVVIAKIENIKPGQSVKLPEANKS